MTCRLCGTPMRESTGPGIDLCIPCDDRIMARAEALLLEREASSSEPDWERHLPRAFARGGGVD